MEKGNDNNYMQDEHGSRMKRHWRCCFVQVSVRQDKDAVLLFKASRDSDHVLLLIALGRVEEWKAPFPLPLVLKILDNGQLWGYTEVYMEVYGGIWYMEDGGIYPRCKNIRITLLPMSWS